MTVRCTAFFAASLDGFVARPDRSIDWLDAAVAAASQTGIGRSMMVLSNGRSL